MKPRCRLAPPRGGGSWRDMCFAHVALCEKVSPLDLEGKGGGADLEIKKKLQGIFSVAELVAKCIVA